MRTTATQTQTRKSIFAAKRAREYERYHSDQAHAQAKREAAKVHQAEVRVNQTPAEREAQAVRLAAWEAENRASRAAYKRAWYVNHKAATT